MELPGQFIVFSIPEAALNAAFAVVDDEPADESWIIMGQIETETPGLGLWVKVESWTSPDGKTRKRRPRAATLFRWEWIGAASVSSKPTTTPPIGFLKPDKKKPK